MPLTVLQDQDSYTINNAATMPSRPKKVRFETEYSSSFKASKQDAYVSPLIEALIDEPSGQGSYKKSETIAGLQSQKFSKTIEPLLQHKRVAPTDNIERFGNTKKNYHDGARRASPTTKAEKNRALELKAGLRTETSSEKKKHPVSEYKRQYDWKKTIADRSPLLNAEKIVFDSHTSIPRFVRDKITHTTEYQSKFAVDTTKREELKERKDIEKEKYEDVPKTTKRLLQTSQNPDVPFFPHGTRRVGHTEYQANFGSPKKYEYQEGIWLGAKSPHLLADYESTQGSTELITNWFEEVLELRAKARDYKTRAVEGNYFSREYLDAELEQMYEEPSADSNDSRKRKKNGSQHSDELGVRPAVKLAWESDSSDGKDGKEIYKDLNKQFKSASLDDETLSSSSQDKSIESEAPISGKDQEDKPLFDKTFPRKSLSPSLLTTTVAPRRSKRNSPLLRENSSGSDASSERSDNCSKNSIDPGTDKHLKTHTPCNGQYNPDHFNIDTIQAMRSNDMEVLRSSLENNYGSSSDKCGKGNEYDNESDCMSESSFANRESMARHTLARAKQRNAKVWKKI